MMAYSGFFIVGGMRGKEVDTPHTVKRLTHHTQFVLILSQKMLSSYILWKQQCARITWSFLPEIVSKNNKSLYWKLNTERVTELTVTQNGFSNNSICWELNWISATECIATQNQPSDNYPNFRSYVWAPSPQKAQCKELEYHCRCSMSHTKTYKLTLSGDGETEFQIDRRKFDF
jgi:hypothetical protein